MVWALNRLLLGRTLEMKVYGINKPFHLKRKVFTRELSIILCTKRYRVQHEKCFHSCSRQLDKTPQINRNELQVKKGANDNCHLLLPAMPWAHNSKGLFCGVRVAIRPICFVDPFPRFNFGFSHSGSVDSYDLMMSKNLKLVETDENAQTAWRENALFSPYCSMLALQISDMWVCSVHWWS